MEVGSKEEKEKDEHICSGKPRLQSSGSQGKRKYISYLFEAIAVIIYLNCLV